MLDEEALDRELGAWFARSGRVLEVREATTPWQVLVVEVMSQQTQIGRVGPYWRRFVERWPTPAAFAEASTRDVLNAWAGLGYNRRPLALRDAARRIVAEHGLHRVRGTLPPKAAQAPTGPLRCRAAPWPP